MSRWYGFSLEWVAMQNMSLCDDLDQIVVKKQFWHIWHWYGFTLGVSHAMTLKVILSCKAFMTNLTLVLFLFVMSSDMTFKMTLLWKGSMTNVTLVWFFFRVSPHVTI